MASQCHTASTRQEEKDHRLAILIQQQETLAARQPGIKFGQHYTPKNEDIDLAIKESLLSSSSQLKGRSVEKSQSGDVETDGPPTCQRSSQLLTFSLSGAKSLPEVKGRSVPAISSRRARHFNMSDSSGENHVVALADEHMVWRQTAPVDGAAGHLSDQVISNESEEDEHLNVNFNENERISSDDNEENPEIQGASNSSERRRSLGNDEDEDEIAKEIEELLKRGTISASEAESIQESQQQKFRLNNMTKWERDNEDEELRPFIFDSDGIPINWTDDGESTNLRPGHSMDVRLIDLHPGQMEYDKIDDEFKETGINITKIERIQNTYLLDRFKSEMEDTTRRRHSGFDLNIRYLYHGTKADKSRICEEGLDQRLSRMGYFGKGIYFSDNPLKCVYYTENMDSLGDAYILKCRVILGDSKCFPEGQYDTALKREPEKENVRPGQWRFYDSVVGCPRDYNEFVVYENRRAMIEYIISFKIGPEGAAAMQQLNTAPASVAKNKGEPFDDSHLDRIREVREAVRRKRCRDRGIAYTEPNQNKKQQDDHMWNKLQVLHGVEQTEVKPGKIMPGASTSAQPRSQLDDTKIYNTESFTTPVTIDTWQDLPSHRGAPSWGGNYGQEPDPVEQVMSGLLQEFLGVTDTEDVEVAKYYITSNQMNINDALMNYYNDLP